MLYQLLPQFIDKATTNLLYTHCKLLDKRLQWLEDNHNNNFDRNQYGTFNDQQVPGALSKYADPIFEALLHDKKEDVEKLTGKKLSPSYSYVRLYKKGNELLKHTDRASCEVTLSLCLGFEGPEWPLHLQTEEGHKQIVLQAGDALWYEGTNITHWRYPFEGSLQAQVFLHYNSTGDKFDQRPVLGLPHKYKQWTN
tara:strand:+ start:133 stop:720 length:588 start_codon:yes stop_codon:yes gene_type:complete